MAEFFEADVAASAAKLQKTLATIDRNIAIQEEIGVEGNETLIRIRALRAQLSEQAVTPMSAGELTAATHALEQQNVLRRAGAEIDMQTLDLLKAQTRERAEQAAITARLQREQQSLLIPPARRGGPASELAGAQVAADERARIRAQLLAGTPAEASASRAAAAQAPQQQQLRAARELAATQKYVNELASAEGAGRLRVLAIEDRQLAAELRRQELQSIINREAASPGQAQRAVHAGLSGYDAGFAAAQQGRMVAPAARDALQEAPGSAKLWTDAERGLVRYNVALGEYDGFARQASLSTNALNGNLMRVGIAQSEASNAMRRHGALTTEYLSALARGETTISEFGYQVGATIAKFAGWTAAATATYTALGAIFEMGKGAVDASSGVQQLTRTIDNLDTHAASQAIVALSRETNVPIKEASDTMFQFSRTFHNVADAAAAARLGLSGFKLDQVDVMDSVKLTTELQTQYNLTLGQQRGVYDMLSAGQREYNARMQQTIPALGISLGSVKNAGGDLNQLIQQIAYIQRTIPTQGGTRIGTAIYRSASNFLNPATPIGKKNLADLEKMGINTGGGWTDILDQAIRKAPSLDHVQRSRMAQDIFYRQFGGRVGESIFGPEAVRTYQSITGGPGALPGTRPLTPKDTAGSLQVELDRQLKTTRETMHSFINELQRLGAAVAETGALKAFVTALRGLTGALGGIEHLASGFALLPSSVRNASMAITTLGAALLFLNRTRFGGSVADVTRLSKIPGVGLSDATRTRFDLRTGTRAAQEAVGRDLESTTGGLLTNSARRLELERQRTILVENAGGEDKLQEGALVRSNELKARIASLEAQAVTIEAERNAQLETLQGLNLQQTMLRRSPRRGGYTESDVAGLGRTTGRVVQGNADQLALFATQTQTQAREFTLREVAQANLARSLAIERIALAENIAYSEVTEAQLAGVLTQEEMLASQTTTTAAAASAVGAGAQGMAGGLGAFLRGLNPLLLAMIGLPIIMGEIGTVTSQVDDAAKKGRDAMAAPLNGFNQLQSTARALQAASKSVGAAHISGGPLGILQNAGKGLGTLIGGSWGAGLQDWATGRDPDAAAQLKARGQSLGAIGDFYKHTYKVFEMDVSDLAGTKSGRAGLYAISERAKSSMWNILQSSGLSQARIAQVWSAYLTDLQNEYAKGIARSLASTRPQQAIDLFGAMTTQQLQQATQGYGARAQTFGLGGGDMSKAIGAYLTLAGRERSDTNPQNLGQLSSAQSSISTNLNKTVTDITNAAKSSSTYGGQMGVLNRGLASFGRTRQAIGQWVERERAKWGSLPGFMKAVNEAAGQAYALVDQAWNTIEQQQIDAIQQQATLAASQVPGSSPEADRARAAIIVQGYREALARAQADHAKPSVTGPLTAQLNNGARDLAKQQSDAARSLLEAHNQQASASIGGTGAGADLARAQRDVTNAARVLAFDRAHNAGELQIAQDYAALLQAQQGLGNVIQSNARSASQDASALIQAQGSLAEAQTNDPVKQAQIELQTAIRVLATIKPSDYNTYSEYQAAYIQQQAAIAKDRHNVEQQIVDTRMQDLQFQLHTQRITDQQYISGLQQLLKMAQLTKQQRQQIQSAIFDAMHQSAVSLGTDNIKMPTEYEVRRGIRAGLSARDRQWTNLINATPNGGDRITNNRVNMNIVVHRDADLAKFAAVLDNALRGNFTGSAQAMGLI